MPVDPPGDPPQLEDLLGEPWRAQVTALRRYVRKTRDVRVAELLSLAFEAAAAGDAAAAGQHIAAAALRADLRRVQQAGRWLVRHGPDRCSALIGLALLATTAYNVGLIQEKRALGRMPALDLRRVPHVIASLLADPAWLAGFALMLLGLACQTVVLTFEPVSVVQPVLASGVALVLVLRVAFFG